MGPDLAVWVACFVFVEEDLEGAEEGVVGVWFEEGFGLFDDLGLGDDEF